MTEERLIQFILYDKIVTVSLAGRQFILSVKDVFTIVPSVMITCVSILAKGGIFNELTMARFLVDLNRLCITTMIATSTHAAFKGFHSINSNVYRKILQKDSKLQTSSRNKTDYFILISVLLFLVSLLGSMVLIPMVVKGTDNIWFYLYFRILILIFSATVMKSAIMKYLIAKRLRMVRSEDEPVDRVEELMQNTRDLLDCNDSINKSIHVSTTTITIYSFMHTISTGYRLWIVNCGHTSDELMFENFPILTAVSNIAIYMGPVLLAFYSSLVVYEVEDIKMELDISLTARPCSEYCDDKISMFLLELTHRPVQLTALGLYDISCAALTAACAVIINYLMVLIQFS